MQADYYKFLEIKEVGEDGTFQGIASVYGVEDLGGDVIEKGAFKKTIAENPEIPILWQHDRSEVIGKGTVKEWQGKILIDGTLDLDDPLALKAYRKLKNKLIKGLSIGFQTVKSVWEEIEEEGKARLVRHISELKLWEVSVVTFPMLPAAQVTRVKSAEAEEWSELKAKLAAAEKEVEELKALRAANATAEEAAGEGKEAAAEVPNEPEQDLHSLAEQFKAALKSELKEGFKWRN